MVNFFCFCLSLLSYPINCLLKNCSPGSASPPSAVYSCPGPLHHGGDSGLVLCHHHRSQIPESCFAVHSGWWVRRPVLFLCKVLYCNGKQLFGLFPSIYFVVVFICREPQLCLNEYHLLLVLFGAFVGYSHSLFGVMHNMNYVPFHAVQVCVNS